MRDDQEARMVWALCFVVVGLIAMVLIHIFM